MFEKVKQFSNGGGSWIRILLGEYCGSKFWPISPITMHLMVYFLGQDWKTAHKMYLIYTRLSPHTVHIVSQVTFLDSCNHFSLSSSYKLFNFSHCSYLSLQFCIAMLYYCFMDAWLSDLVRVLCKGSLSGTLGSHCANAMTEVTHLHSSSITRPSPAAMKTPS